MNMMALERVGAEWNSPRYTNTTAEGAHTLRRTQTSVMFGLQAVQYLSLHACSKNVVLF